MMTANKTYRNTARFVGAIYIAGFVVGIGGNMLVQSVLGAPNGISIISTHSTTLVIGAMFWLLASAGDAAHGILMLPILKLRSERLAFGYFGFRIIDAVFIAVMALFILLQIPLVNEVSSAAPPDASYLQNLGQLLAGAQRYAYDFGMMAVGIAGLILCVALYRANLMPRFLAVWGLLGYAIIFCGMAAEIFGSALGLVSSLPGGLWELFTGGWLIVKGFSPAAFVPPARG